jgi:hypothetical protein
MRRRKAAIAATRALNNYVLGAMLEGRYDDAYLTSAGKRSGSARPLLATPSCRSRVRECAVLVAS